MAATWRPQRALESGVSEHPNHFPGPSGSTWDRAHAVHNPTLTSVTTEEAIFQAPLVRLVQVLEGSLYPLYVVGMDLGAPGTPAGRPLLYRPAGDTIGVSSQPEEHPVGGSSAHVERQPLGGESVGQQIQCEVDFLPEHGRIPGRPEEGGDKKGSNDSSPRASLVSTGAVEHPGGYLQPMHMRSHPREART